MRKKRYGMVAVMMLTTVVFTSCLGTTQGEGSATQAPKEEVALMLNVKEVATSILQGGSFDDALEELEESMFEVVYQEVSMEDVVSHYVYTNTGASTEQIVVVEARDAQAASAVEEALQVKLEDDIQQNQGYLSSEIPKLQSPVLEVLGNYVILCVSTDNEKVEKIIDSLQ